MRSSNSNRSLPRESPTWTTAKFTAKMLSVLLSKRPAMGVEPRSSSMATLMLATTNTEHKMRGRTMEKCGDDVRLGP